MFLEKNFQAMLNCNFLDLAQATTALHREKPKFINVRQSILKVA